MSGLTFSLAGLPIATEPLPTLVIELDPVLGFVMTFTTLHSLSSQLMERCTIGEPLTISVGKMSATGTVMEINSSANYTKLVMGNLQGLV